MKKSEDRLQQECYIWFHNTYPNLRGLLFHVPNGGNRDGREGRKFKGMGVFPGVADLLFIYKGEFMAIELKTPTGTQSPKQKYWETIVKEHGVYYYIVRSFTEFRNLIELIILK